jgi:hypothetical protein
MAVISPVNTQAPGCVILAKSWLSVLLALTFVSVLVHFWFLLPRLARGPSVVRDDR